MSEPRGVEERISWFLDHNPSGPGMCSQHTWHSLGGDYGNPAAWGCSDANECVDKVKASGRYWTPQTWDGPPPRGAWVGYKYGANGHACLSLGDGRIATTDPTGDSGGSGIEDLDYPNKWGANGWTVWSDQYNGVRFAVDETLTHGPVYLSKLRYGQHDSDSVRRLQMHLNGHPLQGGETLQVTGNYLSQTDEEVRLCQSQHLPPADQPEQSTVGPKQAAHLFTGCACEVIDDREEPPVTATGDYWYSGKPAGTLTFSDSYKRLDVDKWAPPTDCVIMSMLYLNVTGEGEFRVRLVRDPDDMTGYQTFYAKAGDNFLLTHVWFEKAEAGRKLWWEMSAMDSGQTFTANTRYAKFCAVG